MISEELKELPDKVVFTSTGEECEISADVFEFKNRKVGNRTVREKIKSSSGTYVYTKVPSTHPSQPPKKLGTSVDLALSYLQRLYSFGLITFSNEK